MVRAETTADPISDEHDAAVGFLAIQRDITDRNPATERHKELDEQLRVSQKMVALGSLVGGVAHDFNNLLTVIECYTKFALEALRADDPTREDLLEVTKAAERAAALTSQLLAFARKEAPEAVLLDLNKIASEFEKMLRRILGEDVDLALALAPDLLRTVADLGQIEQVLMNLAVNARQAMPEGGTLTIQTANVEIDADGAAQRGVAGPGRYVQLTVTDTGCGMDAATCARIFEPFFTTKGVGEGTGLGLSTVYGILKRCGGGIAVDSAPGRGTTFEVYLPGAPSPVCRSIAPGAREAPLGGTETILVVEDEEPVRRLARRILRAVGYAVLTAANGDEALRICESHPGEIHLLVADVVLPRVSGREVARRLTQVRPRIKLLYISGYPNDIVARHGVLEGETLLVAKPFSAQTLRASVREVLDDLRPR